MYPKANAKEPPTHLSTQVGRSLKSSQVLPLRLILRRLLLLTPHILLLGILPKQPQHRLQLLPQTLPTALPNPEEIIQEDRSRDIEEDEGESDPVVSPASGVADGDGGEELVCDSGGAKFTVGCGVGVIDLAARGGRVGREVFAAG